MNILITGGSGFIGTNLVEELLNDQHEIINIDIQAPKIKGHDTYWRECDILNKEKTLNIFKGFHPAAVIHLAARTDTDPDTVLEDYLVNTKGTENVLEAIKDTPSMERAVITSTQFVYQNSGEPKHDEDYAPHTVYGESKVVTEQLTRKAGLDCMWTIIRPTNIWGPWHYRYPSQFWHVLKKGRYLHPGKQQVMRSYGYVGNIVYQIMKILETEEKIINHKVFYVGDEPLPVLKWVNAFSNKLTGKEVQIVPRIMVKLLALLGDLLIALGMNFPLTSSRYKSMTTDNPVSMNKTFEAFGQAPYSLEEGIEKTVDWLITQDAGFWMSKHIDK